MKLFRLENMCTHSLGFQTIESFFVMWRTTGDEVWRERGWAAFNAIEKHLRVPSGYATTKDVFVAEPPLDNCMPR